MADRDNDPPITDTKELTPSSGTAFVLNQFGETVTFLSLSASSQAAAPDPVMPAAIGRYEIRGLLGRGGFGAVYRGYDPHLDRQVAIKVPLLKPSRTLAELFPQEARKLAQLKHPGIVTVHDVGVHEGVCFIVSEYLDGRNLNQWMQNRPIPWPEAATIAAALAEALAAAHARSIIHRDVKPANVIMTEGADGFVPVLVDFGLALSESSPASMAAGAGSVTGTPNYMSPEQARGEGNRIDGRTDIYALGVILYRLISGRLPFTAPDLRELLQAVVAHEPRPPRQFVRGLPRELERICLKAMAKNLADRYTTASDLAHDLRALVREHQDQLKLAASARSTPKAGKRDAIQILIADDHELSRFKLKTDLEKWGHEVTAAEDGEQAWELFQRRRFAIVITDWMMPKLDGLELVKMIRAADCADYVYIIMLTAKAEKQDIVSGMGAGADDFLVKPFHRDELQVRLRAGIRITILNRQLNETNRRLERGLEAAAQIQQSFLPTVKPQFAGYAFAWGHNPCGRLGGDMFNVVALGDGRVGVYVLDVTGEGVPAALLATTLSRVLAPASDPTSILAARNEDGSAARVHEPVEVARELNRRFGMQQEAGQYFTLAYGVLHLESRRFEFTSASHPPLLHLQAGRAPTMLDVQGFPIGMAPESDPFQQRSVVLQPGDRILIYSDGIPDAMRGDGEVFGAARLLDAAQRFAAEPLDGVIGCVLGELRDWCRDAAAIEDVSILGFEAS